MQNPPLAQNNVVGAAAREGLPDAATAAQRVILEDLQAMVAKVVLASETKEIRHCHRVIRRTLKELRSSLNPEVLRMLVARSYGEGAACSEPSRYPLLTTFMEALDPSACSISIPMGRIGAASNAVEHAPGPAATVLPEVEVYLGLLILITLIDNKLTEKACGLSSQLVSLLEHHTNLWTLDVLSVKLVFYYALCHERANRSAEIRPRLFALHQTSVLHHNLAGQMTLMNAILRSFIGARQFQQARKFIARVEIDEANAPANELARYYYYRGRVKSLDPAQYASSHEDLQHALRKAPITVAVGFRTAVIKLSCIVQLLLSEIPDRGVFLQPKLRSALRPYLQLTTAVRYGDLNAFRVCTVNFQDVFRQDGTLNLIHRLRNNVIMTGLHKINLSYSQISLADVREKLGLDSEEDAEFVVSKAIRDSLFDAVIDDQTRVVRSRDHLDVYSTTGPQEQLHARIQLFLNIHNEAIKAMQFLGQRAAVEPRRAASDDQDFAAALAAQEDYF